MPQLDFRGARGSDAGDDFHELWALRRALTLLDHAAELSGMTVEGVRTEDKKGTSPDSWDGVDCALYFNGNSIATAAQVDLVQVKYSSADPNKTWTLSRLAASTAKKGNNSVLRRMSAAFEAAQKNRAGSVDGISVQLISNQPVDAEVPALFASVVKGTADGTAEGKARKASGLTIERFRRFAEVVEWRQEASRFSLEEDILRAISAWTEGDARPILNDLLTFIRRLMMPEATGEWITRETVLTHFGFSNMSALFPCEPQLARITNRIHRETSSQTVAAMLDGKRHVCMHGVAGCGKTTAIQEIETLLPPGSQMFVFDCYGGGRYLDADAYRHRDKDAFLQLSNELAARLRAPLFLTRSDGTDYARAFYSRLLRASESLQASAPDALLVIAVDAADNSITAAESMVPLEGSFVRKFVTFEHLPENVRLLITARTGRLPQLRLPHYFQRLEISGFTPKETAQHVRATWADAPESWIDDFHHHSHGIPRVQRYALGLKKGHPQDSLAVLLPGGKVLNDVFKSQLDDARKKAGKSEPLDSFLAALAVLPHPVPVRDLAAVADLTEAEAADICADLAPGVRFTSSGAGFADEDFEEFIRTGSAGMAELMRGRMADRFAQRHKVDGYAATHLAMALYAAGRGKEILDLIERESQADAILDPVLRREVGFRRLQIAMQVSSETNDESSMLRTILVGAEAMHSSEAVFELIVKNPDLAAMFMRDSAIRTLLLDARQISQHGRLLFHLVLDDARAGNAIGARATYRQLQAWFQRRRVELDQQKDLRTRSRSDDWSITPGDIAAEVEAVLLVAGPEAAIATLRGWKPRQATLKAVRAVVQSLICSGRGDLVEKILADPEARDPWSLFLLVPLALCGRSIDVDRLERTLRQFHRRGWIRFDTLKSRPNADLEEYWLDTILTGCEILVARERDPKFVVSLLKVFANGTHRQIDSLYTHRTTLIDLQLRAMALLVRFEGRALTIDEFLITPPEPTKVEAERARSIDSHHRQQVKYFISPLIPVYDARAGLLVGVSIPERAQLLAEAGRELDGYDFSRIHDAFEMRRKTATAVAYLRCIPAISTSDLLNRTLNIFGKRPGHFGSDELAVLPWFVSEKSLHERILKVISIRVKDIVTARTVASEKIDALLSMCRLVANIGRDEAAARFSEAHKMSEEIDVDAIHQLRAMAAMAVRAATALSLDQRRLVCQRLHSITTDAAVRLAYQEGFPWDSVVEALGQLDLAFALAAIARWQDTDTKDLDTTFSSLVPTCLQTNQISYRLAVALLPLLSHASRELLQAIASGCSKMSVEEATIVVDRLAWDALLRFGGAHDETTTEALVQIVESNGPSSFWVRSLREAASFLNRERQTPASAREREDVNHFTRKPPSIQFPTGSRYISADEIAGTVKGEVDAQRAAGEFISASDVLELIRSGVPVADRILHLEALATLRSDQISSYIVAEAIYTALDDPEWKQMASVHQWCCTRLSDVIADRLPGFAHGFGYGGRPPLPPLLVILEDEGQNVPKLLAKAIGAHVDQLSATTVYELVRLIAGRMDPQQCATALTRHLERVQQRIPPADLDQIQVADLPIDASMAIARFLRALMSDCDIRLRWRAAHSVRRLAAFGLEPFEAWVGLYDTTSEVAFRAPGEPFYWLAARLWSAIVLNRVAHETPHALSKHFSKIVDIATDESFPHVLITEFAKDAALQLLESGHGSLTAKRRKQLIAVNTSPLPKAEKDWGQEPRKSSTSQAKVRDRKFDFDHLDTVPYWYHPAMDVFAYVSQDEFLDVAEHWIVGKWQTPLADSRWDLQPRKYRFSERNWTESSNGHGTEPTLERFATYLERHALFCAVGELMKSKSLATVTNDDYDRFESWLKRRGLSSPPHWLADLRSPKPLEKQFWYEPSNLARWVEFPSDSEFLAELVGADANGLMVAQAWHETGSSGFSSLVYVDSALVEPGTAASLMRALQSATDPYDYKLPDEGTDFEIDDPPYRLLGWLDDVSVESGIDSKDPFSQTIGGIRLRPGRSVTKSLIERISRSGNITWHSADQAIAFKHIAWSDKRQDESSDRRRYKLESEGERLFVSTEELRRWMLKTGKDVIVSIKFIREEGGGDYQDSGKEKRKTRTAKIIILRQDGSIEACDGRIGTWQAPGGGV